ncbi:MAG: hypothetical protein HOE82_10105 [Gammaproteobacteria bacterium]|jgi:hypothetical protein|nr:hypothetical protein [Gammaproteobacteria bacterium]
MHGSISLGGARPKVYIDLDEQGHIEISNQSAPKKWIAKEADYSFDQPTGAVTT